MGKPVVTTGAEWKAFLDDPKVFAVEGAYIDDVAYRVNGDEVDGDLLDERKFDDDAVVEVLCGELHPEGTPVFFDLLDEFRRWRDAQANARVLVSVPRGREAELAALVAAIGGVVLSGATGDAAPPRPR